MKHITAYFTLLVLLTFTVGCHKIDHFDNDVEGNFDALWKIVDEHYCFFEEKGVDWDAVYREYRPKIKSEMTSRELFDVCADMLAELRDGHTNLSASFDVSYYRKWWSDYPQNYNARIIEQYYFNFNYHRAGGLTYGILPQNVGYIRYDSFSSPVGEGNLDAVLAAFATCAGIIIDVRDNGGGDLENVKPFAARFVTEKTLLGYISHKTGPGHNDFSEPYPYYVEPAAQGRIMWGKPVVVLVNRSTFSAANNFVSVMKNIDHALIVGSRTGGGSGMPFSSELPCGWGIRFSACSITDKDGNWTEFGVDPSPGCIVDLDPADEANGVDTMLDFAINMLQKQ
ncbi:MAG: S41 family peptidase [Muribaculaceae bacterium]|nr:S41 family peptidase [Muribaculaceae bacterium]MDE6809773.1 S41 family peptidase [Muribaculaceae bacterium]